MAERARIQYSIEGAKCTKKKRNFVKNEKNSQNGQEFSKRVFTNGVLCGKLWENYDGERADCAKCAAFPVIEIRYLGKFGEIRTPQGAAKANKR